MSNPATGTKKKATLIVTLILVLVLIVGFFLLGIALTLYFTEGRKEPVTQPGTQEQTAEPTKEPATSSPTKPTETDGTDPSETKEDRDGVPSEKALDNLTLYCSDGSVLTFRENDFTWVLDPEKPEESYYKGTYELYRGAEAELCLTHEYKDFDITPAELSSTYKLWPEENLRVLILSTEEARVDGQKLGAFKTAYYSFFDEKEDNRIILINMNERVFLTFEKE